MPFEGSKLCILGPSSHIEVSQADSDKCRRAGSQLGYVLCNIYYILYTTITIVNIVNLVNIVNIVNIVVIIAQVLSSGIQLLAAFAADGRGAITITIIITITITISVIGVISVIIITISSSSSSISSTPGLHNKIPASKIFARVWVAQ